VTRYLHPAIGRRDALKLIAGASLSQLATLSAVGPSRAQAALQPIGIGIQIFTGAVATVWVENRIPEKRGLKVEGKQMPDGRSVRDAMIGGSLNAGTMNITPFIVGASAAGLTMVGVVSLGGDTVGIMTRKGAGITGIAGLKGKKISVSTGSTTANIFIQTVGPANGLKPGDYQLVNMRPADQVAAMAAGSVDAMTSFEPYLTVAEKEGIGTMLMRFGQIDPNPTCLVLTPTLMEKSPETVQVFLKSWLDGVEFWRNNTVRAAEIIHGQYAASGYANVTREMAESIVKQIKVEPELTPSIAAHIKAEAERMKAANLLRQMPDWSKVMRPDLMAKAKA
jgi:ABC-type nitrate/sulfonate/bicarbonate transport system substrate-binding protein